MELRQVRYFVAIARSGSFGRAADELHVAKSALSKQVKQLEADLGAELFIRGGGRREVQLTEAGEAFLPEAVTVVQAVDEGREQVESVSGLARGRVNVTIAGSWEAWPGWEALLTEFRAAHPNLALKIHQASSLDGLLEELGSGATDIAIMVLLELPEERDLEVEVLHSEKILVALPPDHRLAGRAKIALKDLRRENWVLPPMERDLMTRAALPVGFKPQIEIDVPTFAIARSLVLAGEGITVLGESEVAFYEAAAIVELGPPALVYSMAMAYRRSYRSAGTRAVRDFLRRQFALAEAAEATPAG